MIRFIDFKDIKKTNKLLYEFKFSISKSSLEDSFFKCLVYEDKTIEGVLVFRQMYERIELEYIVVDKIFRKSKIATNLMKYLINYAESSNIDNISLEVNVNNVAAINLYKKFGFEIVATRDKYYKDEDAYLMVKVI